MNRVWDYVGFVIWFVGLGYIVLWLLGMADHPMLSPALHAVGVLSAAFLAVRLAMLALKLRRASAAAAVAVLPARMNAPPHAADASAADGQTAQSFRPARHAALR